MKLRNRLFLILVQLTISLVILETHEVSVPNPNAGLMSEAARKAKEAFSAVQVHAETLSLVSSSASQAATDGSVLIGTPYSPITTTLGNLEAKQSTLNPNTAAVITEMLLDLNLKPGDTVAVNMSGSFPALNIAVLCALDTCRLHGIIISSVGSSSYGANRPDYTYLDMEHHLYVQKIIKNHSICFSIGGSNDIGSEMDPKEIDQIISRIQSYGLANVSSENYEQNLKNRISIYQSVSPVKCFINVGGNQMACQEDESPVWGKAGILDNSAVTAKEHGLIPYFLRADIPVIHLLNLKKLFNEYDLPIAPSPIPEPGTGAVYMEDHYPRALLITLALFNLLSLTYHVQKIWRITHAPIIYE